MLSNAFALGKAGPDLLAASADAMAAQLDASVLPHTTVSAIDSTTMTIATSAGAYRYSKLVLALGAQPIRLALGGSAAGEVLSVNHLDDYGVLRQQLARVAGPARITILGAGLIGCEFADDLAGAGHHVTVIDPNARPLAALAAPSLSQALAQAWTARSIRLRLGTTASSVERVGATLQVALANGSTVEADVVVSAVGLRPDTALAAARGLATRRGIVVDPFGQTSAPNIYALGDCAEYADKGVQPYVAPLLAAARAIARTLSGTPTPIVLGQDAIVVKTASIRLALAPPPVGSQGSWVDSVDAPHTIARFIDTAGVVRGYGVAPYTPALRQQLQDEMAQPSAP